MKTAALILHFLSYVKAARVARITWYMRSQWGVAPGATRSALSRLCQAGAIERVGRGSYRTPAEETESGQAEHKATLLGHNLHI